jgi:putative endonuclease
MTRAAARDFGERSETAAADFLFAGGYRILARNFAAPGGEIDIVAASDSVIAFVEVKARAEVEAALASITPAKRRRMSRAVAAWVSRNPWAGQDWTLRGDAVVLDASRPPLHIEDALALEFEDRCP